MGGAEWGEERPGREGGLGEGRGGDLEGVVLALPLGHLVGWHLLPRCAHRAARRPAGERALTRNGPIPPDEGGGGGGVEPTRRAERRV